MDSPPITVQRENPHSEVAAKLIGALSAELSRRYADMNDDGKGSFQPQHAAAPGGAFVVAWLNDEPVGCGALRPITKEVVEIKRMYVAEGARRLGVGRRILSELERLAVSFGYQVILLETGVRQPEALLLYERGGFHRIPPYGENVHNPLSVCFEKKVVIEPI